MMLQINANETIFLSENLPIYRMLRHILRIMNKFSHYYYENRLPISELFI